MAREKNLIMGLLNIYEEGTGLRIAKTAPTSTSGKYDLAVDFCLNLNGGRKLCLMQVRSLAGQGMYLTVFISETCLHVGPDAQNPTATNVSPRAWYLRHLQSESSAQLHDASLLLRLSFSLA